MYINDVHILMYLVVFVMGAVIGQLIDWMSKRVVENKKIFSKDIINECKSKMNLNYFTILLNSIMYTIVLFRFGIKQELLENLDLIKYIVLIPILISVMQIDYKKRIIPNRLILTLFEIGMFFTFLYGLNNLFIARDHFVAMIIGAFIFGIIALLGRLIAGKEAMGIGDIKLIAVLGLFFGTALIISISIISFIVAAIISIAVMIEKKKHKKKNDEYITFGPCVVIATIICIIVPEKTIISILLTIFTLNRYRV